MTETCITWSTPDGNHYRPLCGNKLFRNTNPANVDPNGNCHICTESIQYNTDVCEDLPLDSASRICRTGVTVPSAGVISTWIPIIKLVIDFSDTPAVLPAYDMHPWFAGFGTDQVCRSIYEGTFYLYAVGGSCGWWDSEEIAGRYPGPGPSFGCIAGSGPRFTLLWTTTVMQLQVKYNHTFSPGSSSSIETTTVESPAYPSLSYDCRNPLRLTKWKNYASGSVFHTIPTEWLFTIGPP